VEVVRTRGRAGINRAQESAAAMAPMPLTDNIASGDVKHSEQYKILTGIEYQVRSAVVFSRDSLGRSQLI
jgi:hypothetical protein